MDALDIVQHYDAIRRYLRRHTRTPEDADDIAQIVFSEAFVRGPQHVTDQQTSLAWLYTVARRRSIDLARKQGREPQHFPLDEQDQLAAPAETYGTEIRRALEQAIRKLPPSQQGVVVRRLILGWSFAEIARTEKASETACKMRFVRGLASMRETLEREGSLS